MGVEVDLLGDALESVDVGAGDGFDLEFLDFAVFAEHAFLFATRSRMIAKRLVHPVGPRGHRIIISINRVSNLVIAFEAIKACTELREYQWDFVEVGGSTALQCFLGVERPAHIVQVKGRLTVGAGSLAASLAAVGVVVQYLSVQVLGAAGRLWESHLQSDAPEEGKTVRELHGLEEDSLFLIDRPDRFVSFLGEREQVFSVRFLRIQEKHLVSMKVSDPRFVQNIVADDVWVVLEVA